MFYIHRWPDSLDTDCIHVVGSKSSYNMKITVPAWTNEHYLEIIGGLTDVRIYEG